MPGKDGKSVFSLTVPPRGRKSEIFPDEDLNLELRSHLPEFERLLDGLPPWWNWRARDTAEYTAWKSGKAEEILNKPGSIFKRVISAGDSKRSPDAIVKAIADFYKNQFGSVYKKAHPEPTSNAPAPSTKVLTGSSGVPLDRHDHMDSDTFSNRISSLRRGRLLLRGEVPARELFVEESEELIQSEMDTLKASHPNLEGGGLRNAAVKRLWDGANQLPWIAKAKDLAANIAENQEVLPWLMKAITRDSLQHGLVGDYVVKFNMSSRNERGELKHYTFHVGYDNARGALFDFAPTDQAVLAEQTDAWAQEACNAFPALATPHRNIAAPTSPNGIPVFPLKELSITDSEQLRHIIKLFLIHNYQWSTSSTGEPPWGDIARDVNEFVDMSKFNIPTSLEPSASTPDELQKLASFFIEKSKTNQPFMFRPTRLIPVPEDFPQRSPSPAPTTSEQDHIGLGLAGEVGADVSRPLHKNPTPTASLLMEILGIPTPPHVVPLQAPLPPPMKTLGTPTPPHVAPQQTSMPNASPNSGTTTGQDRPIDPAVQNQLKAPLKRKRQAEDEPNVEEGTSTQPPLTKKPKRLGPPKNSQAKENVGTSSRPVRNKAKSKGSTTKAPASTSQPPNSKGAKKRGWKGYVLVRTDEDGNILPGTVDENGNVVEPSA